MELSSVAARRKREEEIEVALYPLNGETIMSHLKKTFLLVALLVSWAVGPLLAEEDGHSRSMDGMNIYIGILPA